MQERAMDEPLGNFSIPKRLERRPKREDDGREGAISGRLARKATGVSPSGFARTGVFAGKWWLPSFLGQCWTSSKKTLETQGMGTVVRRNAPNGEVPRPLRSFVSSWRRAALC